MRAMLRPALVGGLAVAWSACTPSAPAVDDGVADEVTPITFELGSLLSAPAGKLARPRHVSLDGRDAAILPNGRRLTPAGREIPLDAPKPYGLALSPDGRTLATINSGTSHFSLLPPGLRGPLRRPRRRHLRAARVRRPLLPERPRRRRQRHPSRRAGLVVQALPA
jgi:hypothetical protein